MVWLRPLCCHHPNKRCMVGFSVQLGFSIESSPKAGLSQNPYISQGIMHGCLYMLKNSQGKEGLWSTMGIQIRLCDLSENIMPSSWPCRFSNFQLCSAWLMAPLLSVLFWASLLSCLRFSVFWMPLLAFSCISVVLLHQPTGARRS